MRQGVDTALGLFHYAILRLARTHIGWRDARGRRWLRLRGRRQRSISIMQRNAWLLRVLDLLSSTYRVECASASSGNAPIAVKRLSARAHAKCIVEASPIRKLRSLPYHPLILPCSNLPDIDAAVATRHNCQRVDVHSSHLAARIHYHSRS